LCKNKLKNGGNYNENDYSNISNTNLNSNSKLEDKDMNSTQVSRSGSVDGFNNKKMIKNSSFVLENKNKREYKLLNDKSK